MATSNKIVYTFVAIDKFTETANKIRKSIKDLNKQFKSSSSSINEKFSKPLEKAKKVTEATNNVLKDVVATFNKAPAPVERTGNIVSRFTNKISNATKHISGFSKKFDKWADMFGMQAYFKYMNIALPMTILAHLGLKYSQSLESAKISMDSLFSNVKGYAKYQKIISQDAAKWALKSPFSEAEYMQATAAIARRTENIQVAAKFMPQVVGYAAAMGHFQKGQLVPTATKLMSQIISGQIGELPISTAQQESLRHILTGPAYSRMQRAMQWFQAHPEIFKKALSKELHTSYVQSAILTTQLNKLSGVIIQTMEPAIESLTNFFVKYLPKIEGWIRAHKKLIVVMGKISIIVMGLLGGLIAIGAALGAVAIIMAAFETIPIVAVFAAIGLAIMGIVSAVGIFYPQLKNWLIEGFTNLQAEISGATSALKEFYYELSHPVTSAKGLFHSFKDFVTGKSQNQDLNPSYILNTLGVTSTHGVVDVYVSSDHPNTVVAGKGDVKIHHHGRTGRNTGSYNHV